MYTYVSYIIIYISIYLSIFLSIYLSIPSSYLPFPHSIRPVTPVCIMISNHHIIWICCPCKIHTYIYIYVCILCIMYVMYIIWLFLRLVWDASAVHCAMPESWLQGTKPAIRMADIRWTCPCPADGPGGWNRFLSCLFSHQCSFCLIVYIDYLKLRF